MIRIMIAGVNHNDILGSQRLLGWYRMLCGSEACLPKFVAVEYDSKIFEETKAQRPLMQKLAAEEWPETDESVLSLIGNSLVYEGDLHEKQFRSTDTLWLDEGRIVSDPAQISEYALDRFAIYKSFLQSRLSKITMRDIHEMSKIAWARDATPPESGSPRDLQFARAITKRATQEQEGWGIVVVGASHAVAIPGSMSSLIIGNGIQCVISMLGPMNAE